MKVYQLDQTYLITETNKVKGRLIETLSNKLKFDFTGWHSNHRQWAQNGAGLQSCFIIKISFREGPLESVGASEAASWACLAGRPPGMGSLEELEVLPFSREMARGPSQAP